MSHFLARLVERARGTAPRVEPIIAPRFAPAPATEAAPETEAAPKSNGEKMPARPDKPSSLPVAAREGEPTPPRGDAAEAPIEVVQETLLVPPGISEAETLLVPQRIPEAPTPFVVRQTEIVEHDAPPPRVSANQPVRAHSRAQAPRPLRQPPVRSEQALKPQAPISAPPTPAPAQAHVAPRFIRPVDQRQEIRQNVSAMPTADRATNQPPNVKVTIGRIEVRAIHPPAPAPKQSKLAQPKLSLEEYLHKRERGSR